MSSTVSAEQPNVVVDEDGVSVTEAARTLKIGRSTAYAALADPR